MTVLFTESSASVKSETLKVDSSDLSFEVAGHPLGLRAYDHVIALLGSIRAGWIQGAHAPARGAVNTLFRALETLPESLAGNFDISAAGTGAIVVERELEDGDVLGAELYADGTMSLYVDGAEDRDRGAPLDFRVLAAHLRWQGRP